MPVTTSPASSEALPYAARLVSLVGTPEAYPLPTMDPLPQITDNLTSGTLTLWFLQRRMARPKESTPILLADGRWLTRETPSLRSTMSKFAGSPAFVAFSTSTNPSLRSLREALEPEPGDYYRVATHTRMLKSPAPKIVTEYLRWWSHNVATGMYWLGILPEDTADAVVSRFPELSTWRRSPRSGKWLDGYVVCRDVYAELGGTVSSTSALVDEYLDRADVDPQFIRRRLASAYRMSATAGSARGSKSDPVAAAESRLRVWLSRATPWLASSAPHLAASWRGHLLDYINGDVNVGWLHRQRQSQLHSRLSGAQHRVCDAVDGWEWAPDPYPGFRRRSPVSPLRNC